jgi:hypothetical protein
MSIVEIIEILKTTPRQQEEEYEFTSDFLEWFYTNIYREQGFNIFPELYKVRKDSKYELNKEQCKNLININYAKNIDNESLITLHNNIKEWLVNTIKK